MSYLIEQSMGNFSVTVGIFDTIDEASEYLEDQWREYQEEEEIDLLDYETEEQLFFSYYNMREVD